MEEFVVMTLDEVAASFWSATGSPSTIGIHSWQITTD